MATTITVDELLKRLRVGGQCTDECELEVKTAKQVEVENEVRVPQEFRSFNHIIVHTTTMPSATQNHRDVFDVNESDSRSFTPARDDNFLQMLDDDDEQGLAARLHIMTHLEHDHKDEIPPCRAVDHGVNVIDVDDAGDTIVFVVRPVNPEELERIMRSIMEREKRKDN